MRYFPTFFDLAQRPVLVVGGGEPAERKVALLRRSGARVALVAPSLTPTLAALAEAGEIAHRQRAFAAADLTGMALAIAASGEARQDAAVAQAARAAGLPVNVVDRPALSSFIVPAIVDRDPVVVAISSAGTAPVLARRLRAEIEALLPARLGALARFAARFRGAVRAQVRQPEARRRFWERFFDGPIAAAVLSGEERRAGERMLALVNRRQPDEPGRVALVDAGPGDPELLTLKAHRLLQDADVIVYDRLVSPAVLDLARRDAERIYVGKGAGHAPGGTAAQLATLAEAGRRVVRLTGGDPSRCEQGAGEVEFLRARGIAVEIVPGVTTAGTVTAEPGARRAIAV